MKYQQLDKIIALQPGKRLVAERTLRADEEYLKDHFPNLPVMPGVMMLEALHQAAIWLIRTGENFESPLVLLKEARSVKFGDFLSPNETLRVTAEVKSVDGQRTKVKAVGKKQDRVTVSAQLVLESTMTGDPAFIQSDEDVRSRISRQFSELFGDLQDIPEMETT